MAFNIEKSLKTLIEQGVMIEKMFGKWYNSYMKGGHPVDEFSKPSFP
ncbi:hypothetical protein Plano_2648 [Planococcus sp. PAMC 21323]|nr:hypothetical protein Plano_2648 [Planococcus sp. PAMC 21323]